jgi:hypothetical protein
MPTLPRNEASGTRGSGDGNLEEIHHSFPRTVEARSPKNIEIS